MPLNSSSVYPIANPPYVQFPSRRSVVHSTGGMVACTQPLAAEAGQRILKMGGNAADAAVAVAAALNMTEPGSTGIGGDMFCLYFDAKSKNIHSMNGSGRSAKNTSLESVRKDLGLNSGRKGSIPMLSPLATTVPGAAAGWCDTIDKFGSGKLSMEQILTPAIELGENGFAVSEQSAFAWAASEQRIRDASPNYHEMLRRDPNAELFARAPQPGEIFRNPNLARTFRTLATEGKPGFYKGRIAKAIADVIQLCGGHLSTEDLQSHIDNEIGGTQETEAISIRYSGQGLSEKKTHQFVELWEHPPNGQGLVALMALGILQELENDKQIFRFSREDHNSVPYLHAIIESLRIAFADANWWICDPDPPFTPKYNAKDLVQPGYLADRAKLFRKDAVCDPHHGQPDTPSEPSPAQKASDTVYFCVTDQFGNGMSFINSNYAGFGTCIVPEGCGFTLQNRGSNFEINIENHPNVYAPGKRPFHTIIPGMITTETTPPESETTTTTTRKRKASAPQETETQLLATFGVMGGFMQPQGHLQVLLNMEVFGMNPQQALDAPRICVGTGMPDDEDDDDMTGGTEAEGSSTVFVEEGIDEDVVDGLRKLGHDVTVLRGWNRAMFGRGQIIRQYWDQKPLGSKEDESGGPKMMRVWAAGSDLRGDGCAIPA